MSSELVLDWKREPLSPQLTDEAWAVSDDEALLYLTDLEHGDAKLETELNSCDSKADIASQLLEHLDQLENLEEWIKEEPFSNSWLEEKMLPIFDIEPTAIVPSKPDPSKTAQPDTQSLLQEFENVFDAVNHGQLTPPQSPPYEQPILTTLETISATQNASYVIAPLKETTTYQIVYQRPEPESIQIDYIVPPTTPRTNIAHELAEVDELVRTRVKDIWNNPPSPGSTASNSGSSNFGDCSSDDPEWIPETIEEISNTVTPIKSRKRTKPYSRVPPEDKKSRKKEQNKNAATRYRMKKKAEVEEILGEEREVQKDNDDLANKITDLQREIKYLKGLMRDLFKAKGLIE